MSDCGNASFLGTSSDACWVSALVFCDSRFSFSGLATCSVLSAALGFDYLAEAQAPIRWLKIN
jgi:hypothetical protein